MKLASQAHYNLNGGGLVGSSLHDLNTIDSRNGDIEAITDTDRDAPTGDELDNDDDSTSAGVRKWCSSGCCIALSCFSFSH
jgi:hypothetical protein